VLPNSPQNKLLEFSAIENITSMALKPLEVLKKGLTKFMETIKTQKKELSAKLARVETISSSDEHWLDGEANTIDKQCVLDALESASDYD